MEATEEAADTAVAVEAMAEAVVILGEDTLGRCPTLAGRDILEEECTLAESIATAAECIRLRGSKS